MKHVSFSRIARAALVAAIICVATAPSPSYADTTISENITLTADTDWRADGVVTVPEGVTVDLNGHSLWVSGLAGKGAFTSSVANPTTFDLTTTDASKVSSTTTFESTTSAANLFNNNYDRGMPTASNLNSRRILVKNTNLPIVVDYDFGAATVVNSYKVYAGGYRGGTDNQNTGHERTAKHWKFYGSNDEGEEKEWEELDEKSVTDWNDKNASDSRQFTFFNATAYRHYRMEILEPQENSSNGYTELVQLEYGYVPNQVRIVPSQDGGFASASNTVSGTAKFVVAGGTLAANADLRGLGKISVAPKETLDLAGHYLQVHAIDGAARVTTSVTSTFLDLTSTSASEAATRASATTNGVVKELVSDNKYPVAKAFDNNNSTFTYDTTSKLEINYDFGENTVIDGYRILFNYSGSNGSYPKAWTFDGSDDRTSWTVLDTQAGQTFTLNSWKTYAFYNAVAYRYYRLNVTATSGSNKLHISELEFGRVLRNSIYVEANGIAESDISAIALSGGASIALPEGDTLVLSGNLDLSGFKVDGTIDLNGHTLTVDRLDGVGTITDTTAFDLTDADASRVTSPNTFLSAGPAWSAFANSASYAQSAGHRVIAFLTDNWSVMPIRIDYDFREATVVNAYRLTVGGNSSITKESNRTALKNRAPKSFSFWGSNTAADDDWVKLDERTNETAWYIETDYQEERQYEFDNATPYRYYRIAFHEAVDAAYLEFFKLEYGNIDAAGRLRVVVPSGKTVDNSTVAITGNLRLVKEGAGTLVATKTAQDYRCGTEVRAGTLKMGVAGSNRPVGKRGTEVTVCTGAVVDMNGKENFYFHSFNMAGGTLKNTGGDVAYTKAQLKRMRLTSDSALNLAGDYAFIGDGNSETTIYLNGHTLEVAIGANKYCRLYNSVVLDGTVDITSGGWLLTGGSYVKATDVDFKVNCALRMAAPFSVGGYEATFYSTGSNFGTEQLTVAGVFKPTVAAYYGCTMLAGSTMDLTAWPGAWPMASAFGANGKTDLEFANSGEITVKLAGRTDLKTLARSADPHLFTWPVADGVPVVPGAEFVLDPVTASAGFKVKKDETGLRLVYGKGFMLIVR